MDNHFKKLKYRLAEINRIGYIPNKGITRLAFSDEDMYARKLTKEYFEQLGMVVREDQAGNIWARLAGKNPDRPALLLGSHIDTVPQGGGYDGTLGVMAAITAVEMMIENGIQNTTPLEIVVFGAEESSRFNASTAGSKMVVGELKAEDLGKYRDRRGVGFLQALHQRGYFPEKLQIIDEKNYCAFFELHIEQGRVLEDAGLEIGIVEGIAAPTRLRVVIKGVEAHSGATPMFSRTDALAAAAEVILAVEDLGRSESMDKSVATVGRCDVMPNAMNVVPGSVELYVDIRGIVSASIRRIYTGFLSRMNEISMERQIDSEIDVLSAEEPVLLDSKLTDIVEQCCKALNLSYMRMPSGAGHDTMNIAKKIPAALIFVPCIGGISHNKAEAVTDSDLLNSLKILYQVILEFVT